MPFNTRNNAFRTVTWFLLVIYLLVLTKMVLFKMLPWDIKDHFLHDYSWQRAKIKMQQANLTPFATIKLYWNSHLGATYKISNLLGNLAGFVPLGILLPLLFAGLRSAWKVILLVLLLSLSFECFQLISMLGSFDVDDLLLNTLGGAVGYLIFWIISKLFTIK